MGKGLRLLFLAGSLQAAQPASGGCLPADKAAERMDEYFTHPRSPSTWRALAGLGDPLIKPLDYGFKGAAFTAGDRISWEEASAIKRRMLPPQTQDGGHWMPDEGKCRLDHASWVASRRIGELGADHPYVRQWFAVQKAVFSACINWTPAGAEPLPAPLHLADPGLAALQSDDRAYQQASRLFYEGSRETLQAFRRIGASKSRHAPIARYMVLVTMVELEPRFSAPRQPVTANPPEPRPDVAAIVAQARSVLADPSAAEVHPLTQALIGSLAWNASNGYGSPLERDADSLRTLQVQLLLEALTADRRRLANTPGAAERYARAAADFDHFQSHLPTGRWLLSAKLKDDDHSYRALAAAARREPLAGWLVLPASPFEGSAAWASVRSAGEKPLIRYLSRQPSDEAWRAIRLAHSMRYVPALWSRLDRQSERARSCGGDRLLAAVPNLFYHQVRTALMNADEGAGRRVAFERALATVRRWPWRGAVHYVETVGDSVDYLIAEGRLAEARRLYSAAGSSEPRFALPLLMLARTEDELVRRMADHDRFENMSARSFFEHLSTGALGRLAARERVPAEYRSAFARLAWTRLYATGRPVPLKLDLLMRRLNPEITREWRSAPGNGADPRLLLDVLRSPGLNILMRRPENPGYGEANDPGLTRIDTFEHSDNNWWCAWQPDRHRRLASVDLYRQFLAGSDWSAQSSAKEDQALERLRPLLRRSWLWKSRMSAAEERRLTGMDCAPKLLAERAVRWASLAGPANGQDEALALAVRATRYGCQRQGGHGAYSKAAFELLHRRFAGSAAARRTPYWFDCAHFSGGCAFPRAARPEEWD